MTAEAFRGATLARVLRPQGRRGEVAAEVLTDFPERLAALREVWLSSSAGEMRRVGVRSCWLDKFHGGRAIFHFEGCDSISDAECLRGLEVQIPLAERMPPLPGSYYITDLTGCEVWEFAGKHQAAAKLGAVRDVQFTGEKTPGTPLLVVETPQGELLIPLAEEICIHIDVGARRIEAVLPNGLRELNRQT